MQAVDAQRFGMGSSNEVLRREQLQARLVKAALAQAPHSPVPLGEQVAPNLTSVQSPLRAAKSWKFVRLLMLLKDHVLSVRQSSLCCTVHKGISALTVIDRPSFTLIIQVVHCHKLGLRGCLKYRIWRAGGHPVCTPEGLLPQQQAGGHPGGAGGGTLLSAPHAPHSAGEYHSYPDHERAYRGCHGWCLGSPGPYAHIPSRPCKPLTAGHHAAQRTKH